MNIAIVIGVSDYSDAKNNLPGCKNDALGIYSILQKTEKFEPILYINDTESSSKTKELITNFISDHKEKKINELCFYYSGHGEFHNDEFYYILSDYNPKKRNQTSLQNSEIDDLFRTLNPDLVVKVIDACQSGTTYIKESNVISKYFNETKSGFNKCYFLNSSLNDQSSYQNESFSFFTLSLINALKDFKTDEIRYKDIIDFIADEFYGDPEQTPFFIIQADYTEKFCTISKSLRKYLETFSQNTTENIEGKGQKLSITDLVIKDAEEYADKDKALKMLDVIKNVFSDFKIEPQIKDLYNIEINFIEDYDNIPRKTAIGNWIKENEKNYFAKVIYEKVRDYSSTIGNPFSAFSGYNSNFLSSNRETVEEPKYKTQVIGFEQNIEVPFKTISIDFIGKYPNITNYNCKIIFLLSLKNIRFFYFITNYLIENWDNQKLNINDIEWTTSEYKITNLDSLKSGIDLIKDKFQSKIKKDLTDRFKITDSTDLQSMPIKKIKQ